MEQILDEFINTLRTNLPAKLDEIESRYTGPNALELEDVQEIAFGERPNGIFAAYPALAVNITDSPSTFERGWKTTTLHIVVQGGLQLLPNIDASIQTQEIDLLNRKKLRYIEAIVEVIMADRTLKQKLSRLVNSNIELVCPWPNKPELFGGFTVHFEGLYIEKHNKL